jgi:hypothetical protein
MGVVFIRTLVMGKAGNHIKSAVGRGLISKLVL